jgi:2-phospho-L-lactate/phosphoenolpyruvate guanylyltransferase
VTRGQPGAVVVQATVRSYDERDGSGTVFLDDGTVLAFGSAALRAGGMRLTRAGQRVRMTLDGSGRVTAVTLVTLPLPNDVPAP